MIISFYSIKPFFFLTAAAAGFPLLRLLFFYIKRRYSNFCYTALLYAAAPFYRFCAISSAIFFVPTSVLPSLIISFVR